MAVAFMAFMAFMAIACIIYCSWRGSSRDDQEVELAQNLVVPEVVINVDEGIWKIPYEMLKKATNSFDKAAKIGVGGFADVYKAKLITNSGVEKWVAIKKLKHSIKVEAFHNEVDSAGNLRHRYLVQLIGYAFKPEGEVLLIVFEFVPNGTLHSHLFEAQSSTLSWENRFKITSCLASAVQYIHHGCTKCLVHRDIKPMNVMLEEDFTPKLGDFGLSKLSEHGKSLSYSSAEKGTLGYLAPEVQHGEKASKKSDVFSFGVVVLQIATGRKVVMEDGLQLVSWVWFLNSQGRVLKAMDPRLEGEYDKVKAKCLLRVGLRCCEWDPYLRPDINDVVSMLDGKTPIKVQALKGHYMEVLKARGCYRNKATRILEWILTKPVAATTQCIMPQQALQRSILTKPVAATALCITPQKALQRSVELAMLPNTQN